MTPFLPAPLLRVNMFEFRLNMLRCFPMLRLVSPAPNVMSTF